jgi:putative transposase
VNQRRLTSLLARDDFTRDRTPQRPHSVRARTATGVDGLDWKSSLALGKVGLRRLMQDVMGARKPKTELFCHLVWATWDRSPLITPENEARLYAAMLAKLREFRCTDITIGGVSDHVHIALRFPPTVAIAELVKQVKGASSHCMTHAVGVPDFQWQGGYGAFTFARRSLPKISDYVANQKAHHANATFVPYLEETEEMEDA